MGASIKKGHADSVTAGEVHASKRNPRVVRLTVQAARKAADSKGDGKFATLPPAPERQIFRPHFESVQAMAQRVVCEN